MDKEYNVENNNDDIADGLVPDSRIIEIIRRMELAKSEFERTKMASFKQAS